MKFLNNNPYNIYFHIYIPIISIKTYIEAKDNKINLQLLNKLKLLIYKKLLKSLLKTFFLNIKYNIRHLHQDNNIYILYKTDIQ